MPEALWTSASGAESPGREIQLHGGNLCNIYGTITFGELTPYPGEGLAMFEPEEIDYILGEK